MRIDRRIEGEKIYYVFDADKFIEMLIDNDDFIAFFESYFDKTSKENNVIIKKVDELSNNSIRLDFDNYKKIQTELFVKSNIAQVNELKSFKNELIKIKATLIYLSASILMFIMLIITLLLI